MVDSRCILCYLSMCCLFLALCMPAVGQTPIWMKFEREFESSQRHENPLYEVQQFNVCFQSPSGRTKTVDGFWDGDKTWRIRFIPDETGTWSYWSISSDTLNTGLHGVKGTFECTPSSTDSLAIYTKGSIERQQGAYYLSHADGTPFFYTACTAWNGTLKSSEPEWETYLEDRVNNHYNVIQFTATQWRGGDKNSEDEVAFEGSGRIKINPAYFQHLDKKVDAINRHGLIAAPVLLWALPVSAGRELSPGYYLPDQEAVLLAKYMVARYGGNHVIWLLGGDGRYIGEFEQRWKNIGRAVFGSKNRGVVALHSQGKSWIGKEYAHEEWLDIIGYQTGHSNDATTLEWITQGPVASEWAKLPPKVFINMEPCYEDISPAITDKEVRNASYWSMFSAPVAGIAYGANGIWPWIRPADEILNHVKPAFLRPWDESLKLPGSIQVGKLARFINQYEWWQLKPAQELLINQQAESEGYISVLRSDDHQTIMAYVPIQSTLKILNPFHVEYEGSWYDPVTGESTNALLSSTQGVIETASPKAGDMVLVLKQR